MLVDGKYYLLDSEYLVLDYRDRLHYLILNKFLTYF